MPRADVYLLTSWATADATMIGGTRHDVFTGYQRQDLIGLPVYTAAPGGGPPVKPPINQPELP